ncbi:MAG TPA: 1,4-alpha-glucan branching protein domain-containing protein [Herpetosiphonaceae bacterium]
MINGNVAIVLNAHFPYVRRAGRWPHGEESLHEVIAESYVPLLTMLHDLRSSGRSWPLTVSISPVLLEQLADPVIAKHFIVWLGNLRERAAEDLADFEAQHNSHAAYLARFYIDWIDVIEHNFVERFGRNLTATIRSLIRESTEMLLAPATYAYLPQLSSREIRAQLEAGALVVLRQLGQRPSGLWLPSGGAPALQTYTRELGLRYAVGTHQERTGISQDAHGLPTVHPDHVLAEHVLAPGIGYPGDGLYREFYRDHPTSGLAYWRVTGADVPAENKDWYDPYLAFSRVEQHAEHFVRAIRERLHAASAHAAEPTVVIAFDAELFGHWWFEGVRWLQSVVNRLIDADDIRLATLSQVYTSLPRLDAIAHEANPLFDTPLIDPLRQRLQQASSTFAAVVRLHPTAEGLEEELLSQAARELLLGQSGDWAALIATGAAQDYAQRRFDEHLSRFDRLIYYIERDEPSPDAENYLSEIAELDNLFPFLNYRMFA